LNNRLKQASLNRSTYSIIEDNDRVQDDSNEGEIESIEQPDLKDK